MSCLKFPSSSLRKKKKNARRSHPRVKKGDYLQHLPIHTKGKLIKGNHEGPHRLAWESPFVGHENVIQVD